MLIGVILWGFKLIFDYVNLDKRREMWRSFKDFQVKPWNCKPNIRVEILIIILFLMWTKIKVNGGTWTTVAQYALYGTTVSNSVADSIGASSQPTINFPSNITLKFLFYILSKQN